MIKDEAKYRALLDKQIIAACGTSKDWIPGCALGSEPKFFIVGDEPTPKDWITRRPFSGPFQDVLANLFHTLQQKYQADPEDCYITYLVKTNYPNPGDLTYDRVAKDWLEVAKLEYLLSGCDTVVCIGKVSRQFAGLISQRPASVPKFSPSILDKAKYIWQTIKA